MTWPIEILKIYPEERFLIKYFAIKYLILLKSPNYDGNQRGLASVVYNFFEKMLPIVALLHKLGQRPQLLKTKLC